MASYSLIGTVPYAILRFRERPWAGFYGFISHGGGSSKGRTADFGSVNLGSIPSPPANSMARLGRLTNILLNEAFWTIDFDTPYPAVRWQGGCSWQ